MRTGTGASVSATRPKGFQERVKKYFVRKVQYKKAENTAIHPDPVQFASSKDLDAAGAETQISNKAFLSESLEILYTKLEE